MSNSWTRSSNEQQRHSHQGRRSRSPSQPSSHFSRSRHSSVEALSESAEGSGAFPAGRQVRSRSASLIPTTPEYIPPLSPALVDDEGIVLPAPTPRAVTPTSDDEVWNAPTPRRSPTPPPRSLLSRAPTPGGPFDPQSATPNHSPAFDRSRSSTPTPQRSTRRRSASPSRRHAREGSASSGSASPHGNRGRSQSREASQRHQRDFVSGRDPQGEVDQAQADAPALIREVHRTRSPSGETDKENDTLSEHERRQRARRRRGRSGRRTDLEAGKKEARKISKYFPQARRLAGF